jgi:AraC family transcriptional regulator of adaptative response / DNA-3-methyladenine glycosylase II
MMTAPVYESPDVCERATRSGDPRFDGRFVVGVRTTGVYCRPHCPGRPKPENVRHYACVADARRAGLRACLRCRPDEDFWRSKSRPLAIRRRDGDLDLPYVEPLDWGALLGFLGTRAIPGVEEVIGETYRRIVRSAGRALVVQAAPSGPGRIRLSGEGCKALVVAARRAFDLDANPSAIAGDLAADALLAPLVETRPGLRLPGAWDGFEIAVRAVLGQQVSVAAARTLAGRLVSRFGEPVSAPTGSLTHAFPAPEALAVAPVEEIGLPGTRAATIRALASAVTSGAVDLSERDPARLAAALQALPGVGPWTASYVCMRALGDPDAFPAADLGVLQALSGGARRPTARAAEERSRPWRPWRAYAVMHLWASLGEPVAAAR